MARPIPRADATMAPADAALHLQRTVGNAATTTLLQGSTVSAAAAAGGALTAQRQAAAQLADPMLRVGARGEAVRLLQDQLVQAGAAVAVDGAFGPITRTAVIAFQRAAGLSADGIVGPLTWAALKTGTASISAPPGPSPFTQAHLVDKVSARLQGIAAKLRSVVAVPDGSLGNGSGPGAVFGAAGHHGSLATVAGLSGFGFVPSGGAASSSPTPAGAGGTSQHSGGAVPDLGAVASAAGQVLELAAQPQVTDALGSVAGDLSATVAPLAAGVTDVPLEQVAVQLNTVSAQVGQAVANQAGQATGTGSTTVAVVRDTTYKITGSTIAEVGQELDAHMAIHGEAAHVAQIQPDPSKPPNTTDNQKGPSMSVTTDAAGKVTAATVIVNLERVLPEWTKASSTTCACWKKEWDRFHAAIEAHEQAHVNKEVEFFTGMHLKVVGKSEDDAYKLFFDICDKLDAAQKAFDTKTRNGQEPSPGTKFNAGTPCSC